MPRHRPDPKTCTLGVCAIALCLAAAAGAADEAPAEQVVRQALAAVHQAMDVQDEERAGAVERAVERWAPELRALGDEASAREALFHVRVDLGRTYVQAGLADDARRTFRQVAREGQGSRWAERAEGWVYELDHLNVGQPAPEFEATTLTGETLSAEGLEGRVAVLSFWGTY